VAARGRAARAAKGSDGGGVCSLVMAASRAASSPRTSGGGGVVVTKGMVVTCEGATTTIGPTRRSHGVRSHSFYTEQLSTAGKGKYVP
jgi:hypothetical protein